MAKPKMTKSWAWSEQSQRSWLGPEAGHDFLCLSVWAGISHSDEDGISFAALAYRFERNLDEFATLPLNVAPLLATM